MTNEQAIAILREMQPTIAHCDKDARRQIAIRMAIEALSERTDNVCKNENMDYDEVDQFVCSKCGIELQDWHGGERDEDSFGFPECTFYEYSFKFCPNCGRKVVDE